MATTTVKINWTRGIVSLLNTVSGIMIPCHTYTMLPPPGERLHERRTILSGRGLIPDIFIRIKIEWSDPCESYKYRRPCEVTIARFCPGFIPGQDKHYTTLINEANP